MVMDNKEGNCPRIEADIYFEIQYEKAPDGSIIYKDCSCSEMICCMDYDEEQCPKIWANFFNSIFGTNVSPEATAPAGTAEAPPEPLPQEDEAQDQAEHSPEESTDNEIGNHPPSEETGPDQEPSP